MNRLCEESCVSKIKEKHRKKKAHIRYIILTTIKFDAHLDSDDAGQCNADFCIRKDTYLGKSQLS